MALLSFVIISFIAVLGQCFPAFPAHLSPRHGASAAVALSGGAYGPHIGYSDQDALHYFNHQSALHAALPPSFSPKYNTYNMNSPSAYAAPGQYSPYNPLFQQRAAAAARSLRNPVSAPVPHYLFPHHDDTHIFGGNVADEEYVCSLVYLSMGCSGVLVTPTAVLTAAHCFPSWITSSQVLVYIGDRKRGTSSHVPVTGVYKLAAWDGKATNGYDMGLITLGAAQPAECAVLPQVYAEVAPRDGDDVVALGYGRGSRFGAATAELRQAKLKIAVSGETLTGNSECRRQDGSSSGTTELQILCAVSPGYPHDQTGGTCAGDSGGPLIKVYRGRKWVVGLNSYSSTDCGKAGNVDKFTRVFENRFAIARALGINDFSDWTKLP